MLNAIISGFLFYLYILIDNWFWILFIGVFIFINIWEMKGVEEEFTDDHREIY